MNRILLVFGTRPEAIKLAPVYRELINRGDRVKPLIWVTGQHREMLEQVMAAFDLRANKNFEIMTPNQSLAGLTADVLSAVNNELDSFRPQLVLVQGDTTSCFAASLAAFYHKIPVGHVEAGLRTANSYSPFPEEMNRRLTSQLANLHFAPTSLAKDNLIREGVAPETVFVTGNTVIDALDYIVERVKINIPALPEEFPIEAVKHNQKIVLITGHRRESFGEGFENLCQAISTLSQQHREVSFVYPVHLNPSVQEPVYRILGGCPNVHLTKPLSYEAFVWAMYACYFLLSDSGGVQEEAPRLGKPVLVMRDTTERPEAVMAGTALLVGTSTASIVEQATRLLLDREHYLKMSKAINPYGDGQAAKRIVDICLNYSAKASFRND